jgi:hypothetical protein
MHKNQLVMGRNVTILIFLIFTSYWIVTQIFPVYNTHHQIYSFSTIYGLLALWGALCGLIISKKWGGFRSVIGRAIIMFSLGLLAQEFGQLVYSYYYIVLQLPTAYYPSLGDLGFFGSIPLYIYGILLLAKASGVKIGLKSFESKIQAIVIPLGVLILGYSLFLQGYNFDWSNPLKVFLDFGYPFGQAIYVSIAILTYLLSKGVLGGVMRNKVRFILFALCIQFLADYTFLYQTSNGSWVDGGINDFIYLISYFIMTLGLLQFNVTSIRTKLDGH